MSPLLVFVRVRETLLVRSIILSAHVWRKCCSTVGFCALLSLFFSLYRNVSKVKRIFIGGAASLDTR